MGVFDVIKNITRFVLDQITFRNRDFDDKVYYSLKISFVIMKLILIIIDVAFIMKDRDKYCYYITTYSGVLNINEIISAAITLMALLNILDILY